MRQAQWQAPTNDRSWLEMLKEFNADGFLLLAPPLCASIARRELSFDPSGLDKTLDFFRNSLLAPKHSHSAKVHRLVVTFLRATMHLWIETREVGESVVEKIEALLVWLMELIRKGVAQSWEVREEVVSLFDQYIGVDPGGSFWQSEQETQPLSDTIDCLKLLARDHDVRVRYKGAITTARLFRLAAATYNLPADAVPALAPSPFYEELVSTEATTFEK